MLIDPLFPAIETWLAIWSCLPLTIRYLASMTLGLFSILVVFNTFFHLRG